MRPGRGRHNLRHATDTPAALHTTETVTMQTKQTASAANTEPIDVWRVYPLQSILAAAGVSMSRMHDARRDGVCLEPFSIGRRQYANGRDLIACMHELSALDERKATA